MHGEVGGSATSDALRTCMMSGSVVFALRGGRLVAAGEEGGMPWGEWYWGWNWGEREGEGDVPKGGRNETQIGGKTFVFMGA